MSEPIDCEQATAYGTARNTEVRLEAGRPLVLVGFLHDRSYVCLLSYAADFCVAPNKPGSRTRPLKSPFYLSSVRVLRSRSPE